MPPGGRRRRLTPPPTPSRQRPRLTPPPHAPPLPYPPPPAHKKSPQAQKVLEEALKEAEETCDDKGVKSAECAVAFDNAEEISAAIAHKKADAARSDPLEQFCESNPDADECRIYDD